MTPEQRKAKRRDHYLRHREELKAKSRAYYQANRESCIARATEYKRGHRPRPNTVLASCHTEAPHFALGKCEPCYHADYYERNKDKWRATEANYAPGQFDRMSAEQDDKCYLCGDRVKLVADHDHVTGTPRRPICAVCNKALGMLHDDPTLIARAAEYIAGFRPMAAWT